MMKRKPFKVIPAQCLLWLFCLAVLPPAMGAGGEPKPSPPQGVASSVDDSYSIGKGDVLQIDVWKETSLSGEATVRGDGKISLPLIGDLTAAGMTPMALRAEIETKLKEFLSNPVITVVLRTQASKKFYVMGEVRNPGEYDIPKDLTIVQAIARAGGFGEWAQKNHIILLRYEDGMEKRIRFNYNDILKGKDSAQNFRIRANDTIIVP
jgi:polysaccharide biosynthesis/export protein